MNIPDEVLNAAARKLFSARFGAIPDDIEGDKDFEWAVEDLGTAAPVITEWARKEARKEALLEAIDVIEAPYLPAGRYPEKVIEAIAQSVRAVRALAKGEIQ